MQKTDALTLLAIDDKPDNLTTLRAVVRETFPQTRVLTATNGQAGIELAATEDPDVILLDIVMPGMDGFEVCRRIKADDRLKDIPVVFLTALKTDIARRVKALEVGGDGFLAKPLETTELTAQIRAMTKVKAANRSQRTEAERTADLRRTLASLLESQHLLAESETRFKALHNASFGGIAIHDQGIILECNLGLAEMTGYDYSELIGMDGLLLIAERSRESVMKNIRTGYEKSYEAFGVRKNGEEFAMRLEARNVPYKGKQVRTVEFRDITERKRAKTYREMGQEILQILNESGGLQESIQRILAALKTQTGVDAVGLRLQDGEDFPYIAQEGFSEDFLLTENMLAERGADGVACRDKDGNVRLECTCGLVISGRTDPAHPLFTRRGSFWTNDSFPLLALPPEQDPRHHPRNQCMHHGYASMALTPIRNKDRIVGLLHLNGRRKGCFTLETVEILEGIAAHIGAALMRKRAEAARDASEREFRSLAESMPQIVWITRSDGWTIYFNQQWVDYTGLTLEESYGHGWNTPFHPDDRQRAWDAWKNATENGATYALECRLRRADGTYRWWLVRGVPLRDADGKILKWFGTCTDIEHIKQGEIRIESQLEELRRWQKVMLGREDRVRELKREVNGFCLRAGEAARYPSQEDAAAEPQRAQAKAEDPVVSVEVEPRQSLDHAERSRLTMLSAMEDQQRKSEACELYAQRVESLLRLNRMIGATPQELMDYALEESVRLTRSEMGYLAFLNEDESVFTITSWSRSAMTECDMADKPFRFPVAGTGLWGEAVRQRRAVITNDYAAANPLKKGCPQGHVALKRHMNVPVFEGSRIVIVAGVGNKDGEYDLDDVQELTLLMDGLWRLLEHRRAEEALKREQSLSKAIIDSIPGAFYVIDENGRYVRWNAYQRDELVGKPDDQVAGTNVADTIHPDDRTLIQSKIANVMLNDAVETLEGRVLLRGGPDFRWLLMTGRRMLIDDRPYLVGIGIDIHAHKRDKAELQKLDKLQSVGTLAGGIAHDFNNILLGLFGNISIAMDDLPKDHPSYAPLEEAEKSMTRAVRLTKQLLTFAKGGTPVKEYVSLGDTVEEIARFDLTGSNVSLVYQHDADLWRVDADKGQIQQVISNLVINARQAMPNGGHLTVTLENADLPAAAVPALRPGRYVKVVVRDEGCGIEPKVIAQIFDPYFTTKQSGNGLGLATVWSIINKHNGHIGVVSEPGKGTAFTFYLPASAALLPAEAKPPEAEHPAPARPAKILVMDDEDAVSRLVVRMLSPCGYSVATAPDAQEAIALYKQAQQAGAPFDAVIMDLTIPGGSGGKEVIKELLALDPHVRAIVSSGYAEGPIMSDPAAYGFKGTVAKPYTARALREVVASVLA